MIGNSSEQKECRVFIRDPDLKTMEKELTVKGIRKKHLDRREWYTDSERDYACMYHSDSFFRGGIGLITFTGLKHPETVDIANRAIRRAGPGPQHRGDALGCPGIADGGENMLRQQIARYGGREGRQIAVSFPDQQGLHRKAGVQRLPHHFRSLHEKGSLFLPSLSILQGTPGHDFRIFQRGQRFHEILLFGGIRFRRGA